MLDVCEALENEQDGSLSICRKPPPNLPFHSLERFETVAAVAMDLAGQVMYLAPDIPSTCSFQRIALNAKDSKKPYSFTSSVDLQQPASRSGIEV